jgi:hypothetical protein
MTTPTLYCACNRHDPPLFAACGAVAMPGEKYCAWCKCGHADPFGTLAAYGRTIKKSLRLWAERKFKR